MFKTFDVMLDPAEQIGRHSRLHLFDFYEEFCVLSE